MLNVQTRFRSNMVTLCVDQGADWRQSIRWSRGGVPVDLTGFTARMHVREAFDSKIPLLELTTENGRIAFETQDGGSSLVVLTLSASDTEAIDVLSRSTSGAGGRRIMSCVYDLEMIAIDGIVSRILQGNFDISAEVTRGPIV